MDFCGFLWILTIFKARKIDNIREDKNILTWKLRIENIKLYNMDISTINSDNNTQMRHTNRHTNTHKYTYKKTFDL